MLIRTDAWDVVTQNNSLNLYAFPISFSMNKPISKCNKQHYNPNDAEVKKIIPFSQTNKIELLRFKATFKLFKCT